MPRRAASDGLPRKGRLAQHRGEPVRTPTPPRLAPQAALERALQIRAALRADPETNALRLVNGAADGLPGIVLEQLADVLVVQLHEGRADLDENSVRGLCAAAAPRCGARAVYRKLFPRDRSFGPRALDALHSEATPWFGPPIPPEIEIREHGLRLLARPYDGYATGVFLEHRDNRARVRAQAAGRRVLNLFAYTCGFSVAAGLGGATQTVSVDISKKHLEWGRRNFAANGLPLEPHRFLCRDVFAFFRGAQRQQQRFDLVVLDPPTFARSKESRRVFSIADDLDELVTGAVELLDRDGLGLLATNHRGTSLERLERALTAAASATRRRCEIRARPALPVDFAGDPEYAKSVWFRVF